MRRRLLEPGIVSLTVVRWPSQPTTAWAGVPKRNNSASLCGVWRQCRVSRWSGQVEKRETKRLGGGIKGPHTDVCPWPNPMWTLRWVRDKKKHKVSVASSPVAGGGGLDVQEADISLERRVYEAQITTIYEPGDEQEGCTVRGPNGRSIMGANDMATG